MINLELNDQRKKASGQTTAKTADLGYSNRRKDLRNIWAIPKETT
jgi:hypothetical protein